MREVTGYEPIMWGTSIVGFGSYHYKYDSGREGDAPLAGFSPRAQNMSLYIMAGFTQRKQGLHDMIAATYVVYVEPDITVPMPYDQQRGAAQIPYAQQAPREKQKIGEKV